MRERTEMREHVSFFFLFLFRTSRSRYTFSPIPQLHCMNHTSFFVLLLRLVSRVVRPVLACGVRSFVYATVACPGVSGRFCRHWCLSPGYTERAQRIPRGKHADRAKRESERASAQRRVGGAAGDAATRRRSPRSRNPSAHGEDWSGGRRSLQW